MKNRIERIFKAYPKLEKILRVGNFLLLPHMKSHADKLARKLQVEVKEIKRPTKSKSIKKSTTTKKKDTDGSE